MVRKPQPKEAAKAITVLLKAKGIDLGHSLALEVVATVDGYNDWNTMAAAPGKAGLAEISAPTTSSAFPPVNDDDGPFEVRINGGHYCTLERFSKACDTAEVFAADSSSNGCIVDIHNANGRRIASYLDSHAQLRVFECKFSDDPQQIGQLGVFLEDNWDVETTFPSRQNMLEYLVEKAEEAQEDPDQGILIGIQAFKVNSDGRVYDMCPPFRHVFYSVDGELTLAPALAEDIKQAIEAVAK